MRWADLRNEPTWIRGHFRAISISFAPFPILIAKMRLSGRVERTHYENEYFLFQERVGQGVVRCMAAAIKGPTKLCQITPKAKIRQYSRRSLGKGTTPPLPYTHHPPPTTCTAPAAADAEPAAGA